MAEKITLNEDDLDENNFKKFQEEMLKSCYQEFEDRKKIKLQYQESEKIKNDIMKNYEDHQQFLQKIPSTVAKISEACKPLQSLYKMSVSTQFDQLMVIDNK